MGKVLPLVAALRANNPKTNLFTANTSLTSYKTGIPILDYHFGCMINVYDMETDQVVEKYPSLGIADGCFVYLIGKSSTGKTSLAVQIASNIVRPFDNGFVMHYDLEQAQNITRIQALSRFSMSQINMGKYLLYQERQTMGDIFTAIMQLHKEKTSNPKAYQYDTGVKDEFGNPKLAYVPTCVIVDSIPYLISDTDNKKTEEIISQTDRMRLTGEISRFYSQLGPYMKEANIIFFSINHIKEKASMGFLPSPAELLFLKQDESLPGGKGPYYAANYMAKLVAVGSQKYKKEDDGFDGYGVRFEIIKNRTNKNGQNFVMVYDMVRGFDPLRTTFEFAKECGLISGNKNGYIIGDHKDHKFTLKNMREDFHNDKELYKILLDVTKPYMEKRLSELRPEDIEIDDEMYDY